ncbi:hypothetical protein ACMYSQ_008602 [Aspergillus niger]|jgi:hypothetical protein
MASLTSASNHPSRDEHKPEKLNVVQELDEDTDVEQRVAPDQIDDNFRTTRWEIWAYYACVTDNILCTWY